jgi:hypothetical protein
LYLLVFIGLISGCGIENTLNDAINQIKKTNKTFEDMQKTLERTAKNLDAGTYREQVKEIADRSSQVAQLGIEGSFDFIRSRVIDDLENIKRSISGKPVLLRRPVLSNAGKSEIDRTSLSRTTVTIVGWNLDVAQKDSNKYRVRIVNKELNNRDIDFRYITFQGQYAVTIDVSASGIDFFDYDRKLVFSGFDPVFELPIINTNPIQIEVAIAKVSLKPQLSSTVYKGGNWTFPRYISPDEVKSYTVRTSDNDDLWESAMVTIAVNYEIVEGRSLKITVYGHILEWELNDSGPRSDFTGGTATATEIIPIPLPDGCIAVAIVGRSNFGRSEHVLSNGAGINWNGQEGSLIRAATGQIIWHHRSVPKAEMQVELFPVVIKCRKTGDSFLQR